MNSPSEKQFCGDAVETSRGIWRILAIYDSVIPLGLQMKTVAFLFSPTIVKANVHRSVDPSVNFEMRGR